MFIPECCWSFVVMWNCSINGAADNQCPDWGFSASLHLRVQKMWNGATASIQRAWSINKKEIYVHQVKYLNDDRQYFLNRYKVPGPVLHAYILSTSQLTIAQVRKQRLWGSENVPRLSNLQMTRQLAQAPEVLIITIRQLLHAVSFNPALLKHACMGVTWRAC